MVGDCWLERDRLKSALDVLYIMFDPAWQAVSLGEHNADYNFWSHLKNDEVVGGDPVAAGISAQYGQDRPPETAF